jgi:hypothetical protein
LNTCDIFCFKTFGNATTDIVGMANSDWSSNVMTNCDWPGWNSVATYYCCFTFNIERRRNVAAFLNVLTQKHRMQNFYSENKDLYCLVKNYSTVWLANYDIITTRRD